MGVVKRQGGIISVITLVGVGLGFLNGYYLKPRFLGEDELGFVNVLPYLGYLFAQFATIGFPFVLIRFMPFFQEKERGNHGILLFGLVLNLVGTSVVLLAFWLLKPWITSAFEEKAALIVDFFWAIVPMGVFAQLVHVFEAYLQTLHKAVVPTLIKDLLLRIGNALCITGFGLEWFEFPVLVALLITVNGLAALTMIGYALYIRQLGAGFFQVSFRLRKMSRKLLEYGLFVSLISITSWSYQLIDSMMLASYIDLDTVGIYTTMIFLLSVVMIPSRSMYKIVNPLIAKYWKERARDKIQGLYQKAGTVNVVLGGVVLVPLLAGADIFLTEPFVPERFLAGKWVLYILGAARLFDLMTGVNPTILVTSSKYRYNLVFMLAMLGLTVFTNLYFIPRMGMNGAALATAITIVSINIAQITFIYYHFKLHPFNARGFLGILVLGVSVAVSYLLPDASFFLVDLMLKCGIASLIYLGIILGFRVSPDVNAYAWQVAKKVLPARWKL